MKAAAFFAALYMALTILASLSFWIVVVWAIYRVVTHFTGAVAP